MTQLEQEETSYNNFIESMEAQWMGNYSITDLLEGFDAPSGQIIDFEVFNNALIKNKELLLTQPVQAVVLRGATESAPQGFYQQLIQTGTAFIKEVEAMK